MYVSPLYHSLVIICLFIYSYIYLFIYFLLIRFLFFFSFFFLFFFSFLINCFYLFSYLLFLPLFLFLFIGLACCVRTAIQVFLLASKFNINIFKNIWLYGKSFNWCNLYKGERYIYFTLLYWYQRIVSNWCSR